MSILIKGIKMPRSCSDCQLNREQMACSVTGTRWWSDTMVLMDFDCDNERLYDCQIDELPEHHGRLIDADKMKQWFFRPYSNEESYSNIDIARIIDSQATIVEAE